MRLFRKKAEVCIGMPVHNGAKHLEQALKSLLSQTHRDFRVVVYDDGSSDGSADILKRYSAREPRMRCFYGRRRLGLVGAWRKLVEIADSLHRPEYFAWYSDHDLVKPEWLESLLKVLRSDRDVVLAHSRTRNIDAKGDSLDYSHSSFHTVGMDLWPRISAWCNAPMGAGDAVYGLFRTDALLKCGIFREEFLPDRLLLTELQLHGTTHFVDTKLRFRRVPEETLGKEALVRRQLKNLFPDGTIKQAPLLSHATCFLRDLAAAPPAGEQGAAKTFLAVFHFLHAIHRFQELLAAEIEAPLADPALEPWRRVVKGQMAFPVLTTWMQYDIMEKLQFKGRGKLEKLRAANAELLEKLGSAPGQKKERA